MHFSLAKGMKPPLPAACLSQNFSSLKLDKLSTREALKLLPYLTSYNQIPWTYKMEFSSDFLLSYKLQSSKVKCNINRPQLSLWILSFYCTFTALRYSYFFFTSSNHICLSGIIALIEKVLKKLIRSALPGKHFSYLLPIWNIVPSCEWIRKTLFHQTR